MKSLLHLLLVIVISSVLHDLQQFTTGSLRSEDHSLAASHVSSTGGSSEPTVGVLVTGVSAVPKRPQRSKLVFQITIGTSDPKKKRGRKRKGKKSVRDKRRKMLSNRRKSKRNRQKEHKNHYHTLRKQYIRKLKGLLKHGNHYHKPRPKHHLFRGCCQRLFGRKDVTMNRRRYGHKKPSRRHHSRRHRPLMKNSRRGKQHGRHNHRPRKTNFRRNNRHRRPVTSRRRNQWRRTKKAPRRHSSRRKGSSKKRGRYAKKIPWRKAEKSKAGKNVWAYDKRKKSRRTRPNPSVYY